MVKDTAKKGLFDDSWTSFFNPDLEDEPKKVEEKIIENPQWENYDWTDWAEYWNISIERTRLNFEEADEAEKVSLIYANQTIHEQAEEKRQKLAKQEADRVKYQEYLKKFAAEKKAKAVSTSLFENTTSYRQQPKDKSEARRHALYQEIMRQESGIDELKGMTNKFTQNNENFILDIRRNMDKARYILENSQSNSRQAQRENEIYQGVYANLKSRFETQNEVIGQSSNRTRRDIEDKIDNLSRERNNLPW
jgi:hypothetical protein